MFWRHRPILQFLFSPSVKYGNVKLGMPERLWFRAARTFQPINLRRFGVCALGTIGNWHTAWYDRGIYHIPIWDDDSSPTQTGSIFHSSIQFGTITVPDKDLHWIGTWLAQIRTNPSRIGSHTAPWRYLWDCEGKYDGYTTSTSLFCTINMAPCYVDSLDVNFRCRKGIKPNASKKKKLGKKQVSVISSGFHDEFWQWWNLYH